MPLPAPAPLRSSRGQKGNCAVCPSSQLCLLWNPSLGKGQQSVAPTGQRKAHRNTNQEGSQTVEAAAPPAHYEPYKGGGRLRHPSFHSGAAQRHRASQKQTWEGRPLQSLLYLETYFRFSHGLLQLPDCRSIYMQIWLATLPPLVSSLRGQGEGTAPLRVAGEGPCPQPSWFLRCRTRPAGPAFHGLSSL